MNKKMLHADWLKLPSEERINLVGHRAYVGGANSEIWYSIGKLQYHFLVSHGLEPNHRFLDIACGSLRLGQFLIPYLGSGHYFGLDQDRILVDLGLKHEFADNIISQKKPQFAFNSDFDFSFAPGFDCAIAQSLFTHLVPDDIISCLANLRKNAKGDSRLFFTYFQGSSSKNPKDYSHPNKNFWYVFEELQKFASQSDWQLSNIGDWKHPRNQKMILARPN